MLSFSEYTPKATLIQGGNCYRLVAIAQVVGCFVTCTAAEWQASSYGLYRSSGLLSRQRTVEASKDVHVGSLQGMHAHVGQVATTCLIDQLHHVAVTTVEL